MFLMIDLGWDSNKKCTSLNYQDKSMIFLFHMSFRMDSYLRRLSWFNENDSAFSFFIFEDCWSGIGPRQYKVLDKIRVICGAINATQKLYFPKPFFVKQGCFLGVMFTDQAAAFRYDKKCTAEWCRVSREVTESVEVSGVITEDPNDHRSMRNYHLEMEYCPNVKRLTKTQRKDLLKANKQECLSKCLFPPYDNSGSIGIYF